MKKIFLLSGIFYFVSINICFCQKKIPEGKITFELKSIYSKEKVDGFVYFKNGNIRTERKFVTHYPIQIYPKDSNFFYQYYEEDTSKTVEKYPYPNQVDSGCEIKFLDEIKIIAGIKCKKAIVFFTLPNDTLDIWFTDEIDGKNHFTYDFKNINGFIMEIKDYKGYLNPDMKCREIKKRKIKRKLFELPHDSKVILHEDINIGM